VTTQTQAKTTASERKF